MRDFNAARWTLFTTLGLTGGFVAGTLAGIPLGQAMNAFVAIALMVIVVGAVLGGFQAAGLRRLVARPSLWIVATSAGIAVGLAAGVILVQQTSILMTGAPLRIAELGTLSRATSLVAVGLVAGTILGVAQWLVLRVRHWIVVSGAALGIAFLGATLLIDAAGIEYASVLGRLSFLVLAGVLFGALTSRTLHKAATPRRDAATA